LGLRQFSQILARLLWVNINAADYLGPLLGRSQL